MKLETIAGHILAFGTTAVFHVIIAFGVIAYGLSLMGVAEGISFAVGCVIFTLTVTLTHLKIHSWIGRSAEFPPGQATRP